MVEQMNAAYVNTRWARLASSVGLISGGVLLYLFGGGFPPQAWGLLWAKLWQIPQLWETLGSSIILPLVGLLLLAAALLILWGVIVISFIRILLYEFKDLSGRRSFAEDLEEAELLAEQMAIDQQWEQDLLETGKQQRAGPGNSPLPPPVLHRLPQVMLQEVQGAGSGYQPKEPQEAATQKQRRSIYEGVRAVGGNVAPMPAYYNERMAHIEPPPQISVATGDLSSEPHTYYGSKGTHPLSQPLRTTDPLPDSPAPGEYIPQLEFPAPYWQQPQRRTEPLPEPAQPSPIFRGQLHLMPRPQVREQPPIPYIPETPEMPEITTLLEDPNRSNAPGPLWEMPADIQPVRSTANLASTASQELVEQTQIKEGTSEESDVEEFDTLDDEPDGTAGEESNLPEADLRYLIGIGLDPGIARRKSPNEDSLFAIQGVRTTAQRQEPVGLFVVADGMGGHANGQEASRLAVQTLGDVVVPALMQSTESDDETFLEILKDSVHRANLAIYRRNRDQEHMMGTTLTAALVVNDMAYVANIGDSRTYIYHSDGTLSAITRDHSVVARLVEAGAIEYDEIYTHPKRNQIYRALGEHATVDVDTYTVPLNVGDILVLCSDGLWEMVRDNKIRQIITSSAPHSSQISSLLVQAALNHGGADNISVVVVSIIPNDGRVSKML